MYVLVIGIEEMAGDGTSSCDMEVSLFADNSYGSYAR
jgi:hypothetical protein